MKRVLLLSALTILIPGVVCAGNAVADNAGLHNEGAVQQVAVSADLIGSAGSARPVLLAQAPSTSSETPRAVDPPSKPSSTSGPYQAPPPAAAGEAPPMGQEAGGGTAPELTGDVLERKSNIVHPFLAVGGYFTDNVYNSHDNRKSDFGYIISPGIYFSVPGMRQRIVPVSTLNIAPGGANLTGFRPDSPRQLQTYLYYRADIEAFANESSLNSVSHLAEGVVQYNFRGGLQLQVEDQFSYTHNQRGTGFSFGLDKYYANLAAFQAKYQISDKTLIRVDYSNYYVHFIDDENRFRDRDDHRASAYFFYKLWPRTALFLQYEFINTQYSQDIISGSMEHHAFFGVRYDITDKTRAMVKVGYGIKEFERGSLGSKSNIYAEAQLDHKFTEKTSLILHAVRRTDETDVAQASSIVETTGDATLLHRFTTKLTGNINVRFSDEKYSGSVTYAGVTKELHDQYLRAGASLLYEYRDWLSFTLGYFFTDRMSNIEPLSYTNNTVFFRISAIY
jgi:polysaccharide biosynthesis protein VpsM